MQAPQAPQGAPVTQAPARATQLHQPPPSGTSGAGPSGAAAAASAPAPRSELDELLEDREFLDFYQDLNDYLPTVRDKRRAAVTFPPARSRKLTRRGLLSPPPPLADSRHVHQKSPSPLRIPDNRHPSVRVVAGFRIEGALIAARPLSCPRGCTRVVPVWTTPKTYRPFLSVLQSPAHFIGSADVHQAPSPRCLRVSPFNLYPHDRRRVAATLSA